jgi:LysM repeat protein
MATTYKVKSGDTLSAIASKYGVKVSDISGYKSGNPNLIYSGEVLSIGGGQAPAPTPTTGSSPAPQYNSSIREGNFTMDQLNAMGINPHETTSTQTVGGLTIKLDNDNKGGRNLKIVTSGGGSQPSTDYAAMTQKYLDDFNTAKQAEKDASKEFFKSPEEQKLEFEKYVTPEGPRPEVPKLVDLYTSLRGEQEVEALETKVNDLTAEEDRLMAQLKQEMGIEEGKPVPLGVISGRQSERARQIQTEIDFIGVVKARATAELQTKYNVINTIVNLTQTDYGNALADYNQQFNQNLEFYKILEGKREKVYDVAVQDRRVAEERLSNVEIKVEDWKREDAVRAEESARSNLQIYANLIQSGNLSMSNLSSATQLEISKLEVQSGLGVGFLSAVRQDNPNGEIKSITTRQDESGMKYADIISVGNDGQISVSSQPLGQERLPANAGGGTTKITPTLVRDAVKIISNIDTKAQQKWGAEKGDNRLSYDEAKKAQQAVIATVGNETTGKQLFDQAWVSGGFQKWNW